MNPAEGDGVTPAALLLPVGTSAGEIVSPGWSRGVVVGEFLLSGEPGWARGGKPNSGQAPGKSGSLVSSEGRVEVSMSSGSSSCETEPSSMSSVEWEWKSGHETWALSVLPVAAREVWAAVSHLVRL